MKDLTRISLLLATMMLLASCSLDDFLGKRSNDSSDEGTTDSVPSSFDDSCKDETSSLDIGDASFEIASGDLDLNITESVRLVCDEENVTYRIVEGEDYGKVMGNVVTGLNPGTFSVVGFVGDKNSNILMFEVNDVDPYASISSTVFYSNYTEAISYSDAVYRSKHYLMSGSIASQNATPTIENNRPSEDGKYVRNSKSYYSEDGNAYTVVDKDGNYVDKVYKGGAYVTLDQVSAYVFAFCSTPANTVTSTSTNMLTKKPYSSWGKYLRLNDSTFAQNVSKYKYEPLLPTTYTDSSGKVKNITYHEMDIGTTGTPTNSNQSYTVTDYNNGKKIVRGAARIVYSYSTSESIDYHYVFYTYNHYNDFQEYLNYYQGWGERFGQESNGGSYNGQDGDPNPSDYVETVRREL